MLAKVEQDHVRGMQKVEILGDEFARCVKVVLPFAREVEALLVVLVGLGFVF